MRIIIGGDVCVTPECESLFSDGDKEKELFGDILDLFNSADRVMVNLECAVTDKDTPIKKIGPNLKAPINTVQTLKRAGVTDVGLSNNHIFDFGRAGLNDTLTQLKKFTIAYTGVGVNARDARKNLIIDDGKTKIAVIAVCEHEYSYALESRAGARAYDPYDTEDDIIEAKKSADYVIVLYHGGKEKCRYPSPRLLKACRSMIKRGANMVLCQHSHCIGCYEKFAGGYILYGQGNFHFIHSNEGEAWNTGLLTVIDVDKGLNVEFVPTCLCGQGIGLASGELKDRLLADFKDRSKTITDGSYIEYWREFCSDKKNYMFIPVEFREKFAHYLDCEAHSDVWRELYPTYNKTNELD